MCDFSRYCGLRKGSKILCADILTIDVFNRGSLEKLDIYGRARLMKETYVYTL